MKKDFILVLSIVMPFIFFVSYIGNQSTDKKNEAIAGKQAVVQKPQTSSEVAKPDYKFDVIERKPSTFNGFKKVEYVVRIGDKYKEPVLALIADYLKKTDEEQIAYVFVSFYLKDMSLNGMNYAIAKRTPELHETTINYVEPVQSKPESTSTPQKAKAPYANCKIIGTWEMGFGATTTIYVNNGSYYMADQYSPNSYSSPQKLIRSTISGKTAFQFAEDTGEIFVIMPDGLYGYMEGDLSCVWSKIK